MNGLARAQTEYGGASWNGGEAQAQGEDATCLDQDSAVLSLPTRHPWLMGSAAPLLARKEHQSCYSTAVCRANGLCSTVRLQGAS